MCVWAGRTKKWPASLFIPISSKPRKNMFIWPRWSWSLFVIYICVCRERELSKKEKEQQERGGGGNVYKSGSRKNRVREGRPDEMYLTLA